MFGERTCIGKAECGSGEHVRLTSSVTSSGANTCLLWAYCVGALCVEKWGWGLGGMEDPKRRGSGEGLEEGGFIVFMLCCFSVVVLCVFILFLKKTDLS